MAPWEGFLPLPQIAAGFVDKLLVAAGYMIATAYSLDVVVVVVGKPVVAADKLVAVVGMLVVAVGMLVAVDTLVVVVAGRQQNHFSSSAETKKKKTTTNQQYCSVITCTSHLLSLDLW